MWIHGAKKGLRAGKQESGWDWRRQKRGGAEQLSPAGPLPHVPFNFRPLAMRARKG